MSIWVSIIVKVWI